MSHSGSSPLATWLSEIARRATIEIRRSLLSVGDAKESVAVTSRGISTPADRRQVDREAQQVRAVGHGRKAPGQDEREVELVGRVDVVGQAQDGVFEGEQGARVDVELDVQVDRSAAAVFGVQVDLPGLAQRVGLDEVTLVVHVKAVGDRVVLEVRDESRDVDGGHYSSG